MSTPGSGLPGFKEPCQIWIELVLGGTTRHMYIYICIHITNTCVYIYSNNNELLYILQHIYIVIQGGRPCGGTFAPDAASVYCRRVGNSLAPHSLTLLSPLMPPPRLTPPSHAAFPDAASWSDSAYPPDAGY